MLHARVMSGKVIAIPLERAVICESCKTVNDSRNGHCGVCQSKALLNLANVLNREESPLLLAARDIVEELKNISQFLREERDASVELGNYIKSKGTKA